MDFPTLARHCAPDVHISTLAVVVRHESAFNALVIGVNSKPHRSIRPASRQEAVKEVRKLISQGADFDAGYGQINIRNWKRLGVTPETIFDPCVNLAAAQRVLVDCYKRAATLHGPGQTALYASFSCYNTGNLSSGFKNGYVGKILTAAGLPVPALMKTAQASPSSPSGSKRQGLSKSPRPDAFANARQDAFHKSADPVFGMPVAKSRVRTGINSAQ
ncbi:MAG: lytic transglycosylase domain-containing protein [Burkholderiaceae bacterium]|nr:lytic transglycosylase domain-containing protein [Burkholderiaceae bacterium]